MPKTTNTPSLVPQDSCMWPMWQKEFSCPCSSTLSSLSPLQMARAKPTAAPSPLPAGDNPERVFLEITLQGMAQARGVVRAPACPRERGQGDRERPPGAAHPCCAGPGCWAGLCPGGRAGPVLHGWGQLCLPRPRSDQSLPLVSRWLPAHPRCCVLQAGAEISRVSAEPGAACAGSGGAEPAPPPGEPSCTATRCSPSFPFFSHFPLAPPDEPQVPTCRSRVRRLTRFFQSPRRVVGPAALGSASFCPGRQRQPLPQRPGEQYGIPDPPQECGRYRGGGP